MKRRHYRIEKDLDMEYFKEVCLTSNSMSEAARILDIHYNSFTRIAKKYDLFMPNQCGKGIVKKSSQGFDTQDILQGKHPEYQTNKLKKRLLKEGLKEHKCECCNNNMWMGKPIPLELHHSDGNRHNHLLENLILLCPNCHTFTDTYRGKNK